MAAAGGEAVVGGSGRLINEHVQQIAAHEVRHTTKLHDRTNDAISLDEIERILFW
jgi:hypothetical protein